MNTEPIAIIGGGPVGLVLALLLARRQVPSIVFEARTLEAARTDRRLLALSRGTLEALSPIVTLPAASLAPIRTVIVSSRGEFGRAVIDEGELDGRPLGATVRYGDLVDALAGVCAGQPLVSLRRPCAVESLRQAPDEVEILAADGGRVTAPVAVNAEGRQAEREAVAAPQAALVADVDIDGPRSGTAFERFTRDGPLALLPLPGPTQESTRAMGLVWCMPAGVAERRQALSDDALLTELQHEFGLRNGRVRAVRNRGGFPLVEQAREGVREHRVVHVGNAAQTLHPVAGQGLNLGVRDCIGLADVLAGAIASSEDPLSRLPEYERLRRFDRLAIRALTRTAPRFFATRFGPVCTMRSLGLTALSTFPDLRVEFARLLMFGVRS